MKICERCGQESDDLSLEPTLHQLVFGGFRHNMEYRCSKCEYEINAIIERMLNG